MTTRRDRLKSFLPPILLETYRRRLASRPFATCQDALEKSKNNYLSEMVSAFRVEQTILNGPESYGPPDNVLMLVARLVGGKKISISDFGGATGHVGQAVFSHIPDADYTVVENETLVALATRRLNTRV
jgi:hypothetical protein